MSAPTNLKQLHDSLFEKAVEYGFKNKENGLIRDCIRDKNNPDAIRSPQDNDNNFWFGFIREDQPESKAYEGLSFVVFPESSGTHCVVGIGIGSSTTADGNYYKGSLGPDSELVLKSSFVRSFRSLTKTKEPDTKFFFKLDFSETVYPTPSLRDTIEDEELNLDPVMIRTVAEYDHADRGGLLPAVFLVNYAKEDGFNLIVAWLAQYASWRNWSSYKNGSEQSTKKKKIQDAIDKCTISKPCMNPDQVEQILLDRRFIVLQGAPGCGKTWTANQISQSKKFRGENNIRFIQFHAETTYADFVYGIRPCLTGKDLAYQGVKGQLLEMIDAANENEKQNYLLIIDEINRANLANVLGPVFYLFEQDDTNHIHELNLGVQHIDNKDVELKYTHIPQNMYVIATMNTADKSLAVVDFALRRRFSWVTLRPHKISYDESSDKYFDDELFKKIDTLFNEYATDEELNLQPGHSYFIYDKNKDISIKDSRCNTIKYNLLPLIKEYISEGYLLAAKDKFAQLFYEYSGVLMYE